MKTSYKRNVIETALAKAGLTGVNDSAIPVKAVKDIVLKHADLLIPEGTLFYLTEFSSQDPIRTKYRLHIAFPDKQGIDFGQSRKYYILCNIDNVTGDIVDMNNDPITTYFEVLAGDIAETMKSLYSAQTKYNVKAHLHHEKHIKKRDAIQCIAMIAGICVITSLIFLFTPLIFGGREPAPFCFWFLGVSGVVLLATLVALLVVYCEKYYSYTGEAKELVSLMKGYCIAIAEYEKSTTLSLSKTEDEV